MGKAKLSNNEAAVLRHLTIHKDEAPSSDEIGNATGITSAEVEGALARLAELGFVEGPPSLLGRCTEMLGQLDPKFGPTSNHFAEHVLLVASFLDGADEKNLAASLNYDPDFVQLVGARLRASGIWSKNKISPTHEAIWMGDHGGIAFWLDGAVASGSMVVASRNEGGEPSYDLTESGKRDVEKMMKRA